MPTNDTTHPRPYLITLTMSGPVNFTETLRRIGHVLPDAKIQSMHLAELPEGWRWLHHGAERGTLSTNFASIKIIEDCVFTRGRVPTRVMAAVLTRFEGGCEPPPQSILDDAEAMAAVELLKGRGYSANAVCEALTRQGEG